MKKETLALKVINECAAGIDIGSRSHFVAIDQEKKHVKEFGVYTKDHGAMITFLHESGIKTIAMESTGSYWQTLFNALQKAGFDVMLVGGAQTKNVKGRKTDVLDCMWIQKLHTLGLLSGSFLPSDIIQELRTYYGTRLHLISQSSKYINMMQKAMRLMNIRLDVALTDITGKSGMAIIEAILAGQRNPYALAALASSRIKKSKDELIASLQGEWRTEFLFELRSSYDLYIVYRNALVNCDQQIENCMKTRFELTEAQQTASLAEKGISNKKNKNAPAYNLRPMAFQYFGVDLYDIEGVNDGVVLCLIACMGRDILKFSTAKSFAAWLRLTPNNKISGGKIITNRTPSGKNNIAQILRQAANVIGNQKEGGLNHFFKRIAYKNGRMAAITATAHKLALIIWNMITKKTSYSVHQVVSNIQKQKKQLIRRVEKSIAALEMTKAEVDAMFTRISFLTP